MLQGSDSRGFMLLAIEAVALNLIASALYDGIKAVGIAPDWLTHNGNYVFFGVLLIGLSAAYWWTRPRDGRSRMPVDGGTDQRTLDELENLRQETALLKDELAGANQLADGLRGAKAKIDVELADQKHENVRQATEVRDLTAERDEMKQIQAEYNETKREVIGLRAKVAQEGPLAEWAEELIKKERHVSLVEITRTALWHQEGLKTDEPYFEIGIMFRYIGVLRLILNISPPIGHIAVSGEEFAQEPRISVDWKKPLPFNAIGPIEGIIRIRQYLSTKERAESLRKRLRLDEPELRGQKLEIEMNFLGLNLWSWLRSRFEDEPVRESRFLPEHLSLEYMIEG